jgi:hypothetical protein
VIALVLRAQATHVVFDGRVSRPLLGFGVGVGSGLVGGAESFPPPHANSNALALSTKAVTDAEGVRLMAIAMQGAKYTLAA